MGFYELILRARIAIEARERKNLVRRIVTEKMRNKRVSGALLTLYDALEVTSPNAFKPSSNEKTLSPQKNRTSQPHRCVAL